MGWLTQLRARRLHLDLREEIAQHLDERADQLVGEGLSRADAVSQARREFGSVPLVIDEARDVWWWTAFEDFFADVRFAFRQLRKSRAFTAATVITLALGIGANTAVFSVVNAVVLRPLPFHQPDRIVSVASIDIRGGPHPTTFSYPNFFDLRRYNQVLDHIVSYRDKGFSLTGAGQPVHLRGEIVSWDLFSMLGVQPIAGRGFLPEEERSGQRVVVLSHQLWQSQFSADRAVVGRTITIDNLPFTVVGIAPPRFNFPIGADPVQIWTTLAVDADSSTVQPVTEQRGARMLDTIARLKPGISMEQAQAQLDTVAASLVKQYPDTNRNNPRTLVRPAVEALAGSTKKPLLILLAAVGLVLLMACANVANLLLMRSAERAQEFAVRSALGAGRSRLVRQLITESLTLSFVSCAVGVLAALAIVRSILPLAGKSIPRIEESSIDGRVLLFSVVIAVATSLVFSVAPVLRMGRPELNGTLKEGSPSTTDASHGIRSALSVAQVALGLILLSSAALLIASFHHLVHRDLGFQPARLLSFSVSPPSQDYPRQKRIVFFAQLLDKLRTIPGVTSAAMAMPPPLTGDQVTIAFNILERPARPGERPVSDMAIVSPGYFRTIGTSVIAGRDFNDRDDSSSTPVVIVNRAFSAKFFPGENAIGKRIEPGATSGNGTDVREIIGIVGNARQTTLHFDPEPIYYVPFQQLPWCCGSLMVRSAAPVNLDLGIRNAVASLDRQLPVYEVRTLDELLDEGIARPRFQVLLLGSFAGIALLLIVTGLYGLVAYSVVTRTREIGLRIALGARPTQVLGLILKRAILLMIVGIAVGLAGAFAAGQTLRTMLYGITPHNPLLLCAACLCILMTAGLASYISARRATSIDPMQALRNL